MDEFINTLSNTFIKFDPYKKVKYNHQLISSNMVRVVYHQMGPISKQKYIDEFNRLLNMKNIREELKNLQINHNHFYEVTVTRSKDLENWLIHLSEQRESILSEQKELKYEDDIQCILGFLVRNYNPKVEEINLFYWVRWYLTIHYKNPRSFPQFLFWTHIHLINNDNLNHEHIYASYWLLKMIHYNNKEIYKLYGSNIKNWYNPDSTYL